MRSSVLLLWLLFVPLFAHAGEGPQIYTIEKGDTLWGISERFIKDPYYWPNLWANNPALTNPHLIRPGQQLAIYDGRIEIVPAWPETSPPVEVAPLPPEESQAAITVSGPGGHVGFIDTDQLQTAGTLIDAADGRLLLSKGDEVFVKLFAPEDAAVGDHLAIIDLGRAVKHPVTARPLGVQIEELGELVITAIDDGLAAATIVVSRREIQRGARLIPVAPLQVNVALKRAAQAQSGYLVAGRDQKIALAQYDIVYLDLGADSGLEVGNLVQISRPRMATDPALRSAGIELPDLLLGAAVILETRPQTASALVLKVCGPLYRGDRVTTMTELSAGIVGVPEN